MKAVVFHGVRDIRLDDVAGLKGAGRVLAVDQHPDRLAMARRAGAETIDFTAEVAPEHGDDGRFTPGGAPSMALRWAVRSLAKAGTIGVYPPEAHAFPIGEPMNKKAGNCTHRRYVPELVRSGTVDPQAALTRLEGVRTAIEAYEAVDARRPGRLKVELEPAA
jgi:threonine dehydrogenase-like Zn-dependent dehydrogenase